MRHPAYSVRYSVVSIKSSLLNITLYSSVITTLVYNDTKSPVMTKFYCIYMRPVPLASNKKKSGFIQES
jgi:hypothetical protein